MVRKLYYTGYIILKVIFLKKDVNFKRMYEIEGSPLIKVPGITSLV